MKNEKIMSENNEIISNNQSWIKWKSKWKWNNENNNQHRKWKWNNKRK